MRSARSNSPRKFDQKAEGEITLPTDTKVDSVYLSITYHGQNKWQCSSYTEGKNGRRLMGNQSHRYGASFFLFRNSNPQQTDTVTIQYK